MQLSQLAKPFELTVYTDSSSGKALASKLGLSKKSRHVQLRYLFKQDLIAKGQLQLRKIPAEKNQATVLTKHLSASNLHRLLPKLGVRTRAADSKDLLAMVSEEVLASSSKEKSSFFIGMMAMMPSTGLIYRRSFKQEDSQKAACHQQLVNNAAWLAYSVEKPKSLPATYQKQPAPGSLSRKQLQQLGDG